MLKPKNILITLFIILIVDNISIFGNSDNKADAVYLHVKHEYILNADGSTSYNYEHEIKLLTSFAFTRQYGESFILYNPKWQTLEIKKSVTTMADGSIVESPFNAFNEVLPRFASNAAPYLHLREMVVTHTGIEKDAKINFAYSINTKKEMFQGLFGKVIIGDHSPIEQMTIVVKVPRGKVLNYYLSQVELKPDKNVDDNFDVYTWNFNNLPIVEVETQQPGLEEFCPVLYFSTTDGSEVVNHILKEAKTLYKLPAETSVLIKNLIQDTKSDLEKVFVIRDYVQKYIGYSNTDLTYLGYMPLTAEKAYRGNVGSSLDKAILLAAMLQNAGMEAVPVLVSGSSKVKPDVSLLTQFDNVLVMCENVLPGGEKLFLDPIANQDKLFPERLIGKTFFTLGKKYNVEKINSKMIADNILKMDGDFVIDADGKVSGSMNLFLRGYFNPGFETKRTSSAIKRAFDRQGFDIEVITGEWLDIEKNSFQCEVDFEKSAKSIGSTALYEFTLPYTPGGANDLHIPLNKSNRTTPVNIPVVFNEEYNFTIILPDGLALAVVPEPRIIKNEVGEMLSVFTVENNKVNIKRRISFYISEIEPNQYKDLYELTADWLDNFQGKLYFKPID